MAFDQINYTHQEHMHRYACWAAARAAQRGWKGGSVDNIKAAIEAVNLRENLLELQQCKIKTLFPL